MFDYNRDHDCRVRNKEMKSKLITLIKKSFSNENGNIYRDVTDFVKESLSQVGISKQLGARCVLLSEKTTVQFLRFAPEGYSSGPGETIPGRYQRDPVNARRRI